MIQVVLQLEFFLLQPLEYLRTRAGITIHGLTLDGLRCIPFEQWDSDSEHWSWDEG